MKNVLNAIAMALFLLILSGCAGDKPVLSNKDAETSKAYTHTTVIVDVPYGKAISNFSRGLHMCAENSKTPSLVEVGTGEVRMPGDRFYHVIRRKRGKLEYNLRWYMGGVAVGNCKVCQPKGGYYSIYTTFKRAPGNRTEIRTHTYSKFSDEAKAIEKWTQGDLSGCHGFMGKE